MNSDKDSGHANNVANYEEMIARILTFGAGYNPARAALKIPAMQTLASSARASVTAANAAEVAYHSAVDAREAAFLPLTAVVRRSMNFLKASDNNDIQNETARSLVRKLLGTRAKAKLTEDEKKALEAEGKVVNQISASQMGYDMRLDNLDKFIKLLAGNPLYNPNEADLKTAALQSAYNDLKQKNAAVITAYAALSSARTSRNEILYKETTGLHDTAIDAKYYIKSAFGVSSTQYKQISKLKFRSKKL